jgi:YidC/Oxa1 family membrane protein insertase
MDTKRLSLAIGVGLGLILLYYSVLLPFIDKHMPQPQPQPPVVATVPAPAPPTPATPTSQSSPAADRTTTAPATSAPNLTATFGQAQIVPATQPFGNSIPAFLGSRAEKDQQFALQLNVQPLGAGIGSVVLNDFKEKARGKEPYTFEKPLEGRLDTEPLGSQSITVDNVTYDLAGVPWTLVKSGPAEVTYGADLVQGGNKLLGITKTFTVEPRSKESEGFEIDVAYNIENATKTPQKIHLIFNGPTLPPPETNRPPDRQVAGGYILEKNILDVEQHPIEEFKPDKNGGNVDLTKDSKGRPARWAAAVSNYFGAVLLPQDMRVNGTATNPDYIASIIAHGVNIDKDRPAEEHQAYITFQTTDITVEPGKPVTLPMSVFVGPKWRKILDSAYYATYPRKYDLLAIIRSSMCGMSFCTFNWLTVPIVWLLGVMHMVFRDWGLAIIGLVAIVRLLLHPITRRSQISMSKMSKMGPEMERLRKKYGDDKEALNKAMVEFHREQGLAPYLGCLPMFLQMPIWIALYGVLQSTFELRQAPFLWNWTWIHDLSQPDALHTFEHPVQLPFYALHSINLLPVFLSAVMFIQQQFMPKPAAATPEQLQQQKMMQWLSPVMFLFFFYSLPSGLNLYIFTSTAVGIIESKVVRDHLKQREEAEKAGRVFVPMKATRGNKQGPMGATEEAPKRGGPMGWLAARWVKLLEHAEAVRSDQDKKRK